MQLEVFIWYVQSYGNDSDASAGKEVVPLATIKENERSYVSQLKQFSVNET